MKLILFAVMAGHSRPKDGVLSHAYVPAIHIFEFARPLRRGCHRKSGLPDFRIGLLRQARRFQL
jgi:hypothetical protein